jgi:nickel-type superoxide dismutase maturation protease
MNGNTPESMRKWTNQTQPVYTQVVARPPRWLPVVRFVVADTSMQPALQPRDRVLVSTWSRLNVGDIALMRDPEFARTLLVKRIVERTPSGFVVAGDNPNVSRDSRMFGPVDAQLMIGKVVLRYLPSTPRRVR